MGSPFFGPQVKHNVALGASSDYASFASASCTGLTDQGFVIARLKEDNATPEQLAAMTAAFQQFAYAAQTVLDTIDPYSNVDYLHAAASTQMPILYGASTRRPNSAQILLRGCTFCW
ncbi:hypothetical protein OK016_22615 [Vibrio chagasii]|nr:hypothetical protein [Vibrio chagasii]